MVGPYLGPVRDALQGLPMRPATTPIWSATVVGPYPDEADEVRRLALRHLLEPVRFGPMVQRLHDAGVRAFVQVGSGSLTGFLDDALRDREQLVISACTSKNNGLDQLLRVAAALWVEGRTPALASLARPDARPSSSSVTLALGTSIVHFGDDAAPLVAAPAETRRPTGDHPILTEFDAVLAEAEAAAAAVMSSWAAPAAPTRATTTRVVSIETMPYLADHCFYRQAEGWPDMADKFPVVPMTTMLEMMLDAARPLVAGRVVVGLAKVRALRWLAPTEPVDLTITASVDDDGNVDVTLEGYARGKVLIGDCYPEAPPRKAEPLLGERSSPVQAEELYDDRWLFHGPAFQGVSEITGYADNGIRGQLISLDAPGGLLDNAGQLLGFWIQTMVAADRMAFPASIELIELFGPHPAPGQPQGCTVWVRNVADSSVTADLELRHPDGTVWSLITGWTDRRFFTDDRVDPILRWPETNRISEEQAGGWFLLRDRWPDPANRELVMRRYLAARERVQYEQHNPRGRHRWLLGRIAAKDAVRQWLWDRGAGPLYPAEFPIGNEETGRPSAHGLPEGAGISIAHSGELAVAMVGEVDAAGRGAGIDVQAIEARAPQFEGLACTEAERALLDLCAAGVGTRLECLTRFWAAKEAVAKAVGTGLVGRPHRFEVQQMEGPKILVAAQDHHGQRWWVDTTIVKSVDGATGYVVAWTTTGAPPSTAASAAARGFSPLTLVRERTTNGR
jgi:phosphopantetheinyl transferase